MMNGIFLYLYMLIENFQNGLMGFQELLAILILFRPIFSRE